MKIGFDAKRYFNNKTGLGNYSRTLVSNLYTYYSNDEYFLYSPAIELDNAKHPPRSAAFIPSAAPVKSSS